MSWVNYRLSITDYADVERRRTKVRSKGAGFRKFFYTTVLQSLNETTRAQILELWTNLMESEHIILVDFKGHGMNFQRRNLPYVR